MYFSIMAPERMTAIGLATPRPAMSGALPCTASKTAYSSPMFAPGTSPSPPTRPAQRSLSRSPKRFDVASTSNRVGSITSSMHRRSVRMSWVST